VPIATDPRRPSSRQNPLHEAGNQPVLVDTASQAPSIIGSVRAILSHRELIRNLVLKDLKLKYRGSVLGFVWSLVNPLAMVGVYTLAFKYVLGSRQPGFSFFILLGVMAWTFFANSTIASTGSLVEGGNLVKAVRFPRAVLPLATVLFNLIQYLLTIVTLLPFMFFFFQMPPVGPVLLFPVFLTMQLAFTVGVSLILAAATTFFRDVRHFVEIGLSMMFWTTPIVYPLAQAPEWLRSLVLLSPMSAFVVAYQRIFYYGEWPEMAVWSGAMGYGLGTLAAGLVLFVSLDARIGEQL
jgi:ABC-2 type transport system permease protein